MQLRIIMNALTTNKALYGRFELNTLLKERGHPPLQDRKPFLWRFNPPTSATFFLNIE